MKANKSLTVIDFLLELMKEHNKGMIGTSDFITPYALKKKVTFEEARDEVYKAIDDGDIELNSVFKIKLSQKKFDEIAQTEDSLILGFLFAEIEKKGLERVRQNPFVNLLSKELGVNLSSANTHFNKLIEDKKVEISKDETVRILVGEIPKAQVRNDQIQDKVLKLTKELAFENHIEASNRIYDALKKRLPLAHKIVLKKFGMHDIKGKYSNFRKDTTGLVGFAVSQNWISDLDELSKRRIVQYKGNYANVYNFAETKNFRIDIRLLVMSEGEFISEVRRMCDESKKRQREFLSYDITSEINKAEAHLAYLKKIQRDHNTTINR